MHVQIDRNSAELVRPEDLTSFSIECPVDLTDSELAACVRRFSLGEVLPSGSHVMVAVEAVVRMATGRVGSGWRDDFGRMLAFAAARGWTTEDGGAVRAHVVRL